MLVTQVDIDSWARVLYTLAFEAKTQIYVCIFISNTYLNFASTEANIKKRYVNGEFSGLDPKQVSNKKETDCTYFVVGII